MQIRRYQTADCAELAELFYNTVHTVNAGDYNPEQLNVWATENIDLEAWNKSFREHVTLIAVEEDAIVGFGDIDSTGYLDRLYVHKDYQRKRIATAICDQLEQSVKEDAGKKGSYKITTHASITARSFFADRGYIVVKEQQVVRDGISLTNYIMEKQLLMK